MEEADKIEKLELRVAHLESILVSMTCKKCGGLSWDVPLLQYCNCERDRTPDEDVPY